MKIKTDYVPEGVDYLTAGKEYEAYKSSGFKWCRVIVTDSGEKATVALKSCAHLDGSSWTIVQDEPQFTQEQAQEMYDLLGTMTTLVRLKYGNSDEGVYSEVERAEKLLKQMESNDE